MIVVASARAHTSEVRRKRMTRMRLGLMAGGPSRGSCAGTLVEYRSGRPMLTTTPVAVAVARAVW